MRNGLVSYGKQDEEQEDGHVFNSALVIAI